MFKHTTMNWRNTIQSLRAACRSAPGRWLATIVLVSGAIFLAWWVRLLNVVGTDEWFERQFFEVVSHTVAKRLDPAIRLVYLDETHRLDTGTGQGISFGDADSRQAWRASHAQLVRRLEAAGVRVVAFDQYFPKPRPSHVDADRDFAAAVRDVHKSDNTRVVIGLREQDFTSGLGGISASLRESVGADQLGLVDIGGHIHELGEQYLRRILIAVIHVRETGSGVRVRSERFVPSLPLQIAMAWRSQELSQPLRARLDLDSGSIVIESGSRTVDRIECDLQSVSDRDGVHYHATIPLHLVGDIELHRDGSLSYAELLGSNDLSDLEGKIVLVGARLEGKPEEGDAGELFSIGPDERVYGYQVHASILTDLLAGTFPRRLRPAGQFLAILLLAVAAALSRNLVPKADLLIPLPWIGQRHVPVALLLAIVLYIVAATQIYRSTYTLFEPGYHLIALAAGYYVCGRSLQLSSLLRKASSKSPATPAARAAVRGERG